MRYVWGALLGSLLTSIVWMWQMDRTVNRVHAQYEPRMAAASKAMNEAAKLIRRQGSKLNSMSQFICGNDGKLVIGENSYTCGKK